MNEYLNLKQKHQSEFNSFPMQFAFSDKQFNEGMKKLGLNPEDTDKVYSIGGGGFIRKTDSKALAEMSKQHDKEMKEAIQADITGDNFIFNMFDYELGNHEYGYTGRISDAIEALDLTIEEINADKRLLHGLNKACKKQKDWFIKNN